MTNEEMKRAEAILRQCTKEEIKAFIQALQAEKASRH